MKYWNIDIGNVTVTFSEKDKPKMRYYLPDFKEDNLYEGWVSDYYTKQSDQGYAISPNSIGFYVSHSDREEFYPDFHNLPFYYEFRIFRIHELDS